MDPNQTLTEIRALAAHVAMTEEWDRDDAKELATLVQALDEWLSRGGFLPEAWER